MVKSLNTFGILCIALLCVGADGVEDALQAGYRAYQNKDYDTAVRHYELAMTSSTDPGRIACDLGGILSQAERYQEAALYFTRSLEDAQGLRRVKSAYGQATTLTHVATQLKGRRAVAVLQRALSSYEMALREWTSLTPEESAKLGNLKADAEHNRSIAQAVLVQKQQEPEPPDTPENDVPENPLTSQLIDPNSSGGNGRAATPLGGRNNSSSGNETGTNDSTAGRGNLPPLPDDDQAAALSAEEAHRRLDQLLQRLRQPLTTPVKPGTRDW